MRICYLCADLGISLDGVKGASAHVRGLVRAFDKLGHEVTVIAPQPAEMVEAGVRVVGVRRPEIVSALESARHRPVARALRHLWNNVAVEETLREVLPGLRPDLIYERYSPFGVAGGVVAGRLGIPHVLEVNAPLAWEGQRYRKQALHEAAEFLESAAFASTSMLVAVSDELRNLLLAAGAPASRVVVVPNGVDPDQFSPDGETYRKGLEEKLVVGFAGSLKPWHGLGTLAETFRGLSNDPRLHLLVVGDGPEAPVIDSLAAQLPGRVTHVGSVPHAEVPRYVRAMDVAVAPYPPLERFYFSPLKVLEYMAAGRAVVASRVGQLAELIRTGVNGVLVRPGSTEPLADAIAELAADASRRRELGVAAAAEVRERHRWTHRAERILKFAEATA